MSLSLVRVVAVACLIFFLPLGAAAQTSANQPLPPDSMPPSSTPPGLDECADPGGCEVTAAGPVQGYAVSVTPDNGAGGIKLANSSGHTATFTIQNVGGLSDTYVVTCTGITNIICNSFTINGATTNQVSLAVSQTATVVATYSTTGTEGAGAIRVRAVSDEGAVADNGNYNVTVNRPLLVTPDNQTATARFAGTGGHSESFTIENKTGSSVTYTLTCAGTQTVSCGTVPSPVAVGGNGGTASVSMSYSVGARTATVGTLTLTATGGGTADAGSFSIPIRDYKVSVTPDGATTPSRQMNVWSYIETFTVTNTGTETQTYALACTSTAHLECGTVTPTSTQLVANATQQVTVTYGAVALGTGTLTLTASTAQSSDAGTFGVLVVDNSPAQVAATSAASLSQEPGPDATQAYKIVVTNNGGVTGSYRVTCENLNPQLICTTPNPATFTLAGHTSREVDVGYQTKGLGTFTHRVHVFLGPVDDVQGQVTLNSSIKVMGVPLATHVTPFDGGSSGTNTTFDAMLSHPSGINTSSIRVYIDANDVTLQPTLTKTATRITGTLTVIGGEHKWSTRLCANNGRCDSVVTSFVANAPPTPFALDDSLPAPESVGIAGTLGGLPLPLGELGCPETSDHPELRITPGPWLPQPAKNGIPGGTVYTASVASGDVIVTTVMKDGTAARPNATCDDWNLLDRHNFNWNYWIGSNKNDPLWAGYSSFFGEVLVFNNRPALRGVGFELGGLEFIPGNLGAMPGELPAFSLVGRLARSLAPAMVADDATDRAPTPTSAVHATAGSAGASAAMFLPEPGPIDTATFTLSVNGNAIMQGSQLTAAAQSSGIVILSPLTTGGVRLVIPKNHAWLRNYNPNNPTTEHGWNHLNAGISDSSGNRTLIRGRFVKITEGPVAPLALATLRDFGRSDQGECFAFGAFQCGGVILTHPIPGFVTRDRERGLNLVYRSASQRGRLVLPVKVTIDRAQRAPDSLWVFAKDGSGATLGDTTRYAGAAGTVSGTGAMNLWEHATEERIVAAEVRAPASGDALIRQATITVRQFYPGTSGTVVQDGTISQEVVHLHLSDTASTRFGQGWQLAELGRLIVGQTSRGAPAIIRVAGDGSYVIYRKVSGVWQAPTGEAVRLVERTTTLNGALYLLQPENGATLGYDPKGYPVWTADLAANTTTFAYQANADGRITSITDPTGKKILFRYTGQQVAGITLQASATASDTQRVATIEYSGSANTARLTKVKIHRTAATTGYDSVRYTYKTAAGAPGAFVDSVLDPRSTSAKPLATTFSYDDGLWIATGSTRPHHNPTLWQSAALRDPWRRAAPRVGYGRGAAGLASNTQALERMVFFNQLRGTSVDYAGRTTDFTVDRFGGPTWVRAIAPEAQYAGGFLWQSFGGDFVRHVERDTTGRVTKIVVARDSAAIADSVRYTYDALGRVTQIHQATAVYPKLGATPAEDITTFTYDSVTIASNGAWCSRMLTSTDPSNGLSKMVYPTTGVGRCLPTKAIGIANDTTEFTYGPLTAGNTAGVRPVSIKDPSKIETTVSYDAATWNSRVTTRVADAAVSTAYYDRWGRIDSVIDPLGVRSMVLKDLSGRVTHQKAGTGLLVPAVRTKYDAAGHTIQTDVYEAMDTDLDTPNVPAKVQSTRYFLDPLGAPDSILHPGPRGTPSVASGITARKISYKNRDAFGNPSYEFPGHGGYTTRMSDWQGRVGFTSYSHTGSELSIDGEPFADIRSRDWFNSLQLTYGPQRSTGQVYRYAYDNKGNLARTESRDLYYGDSITVRRRGYSRRGLLIADTLVFTDGAMVVRRYEYNARGQRVAAYDTVKVKSGHNLVGEPTGRIVYTYNATSGRLESMESWAGATRIAKARFVPARSGRDSIRAVQVEGMGVGEIITRTRYDAAGRVDSVETMNTGGSLPAKTWYSMGVTATSYNKLDQLRSYTSREPSFAMQRTHTNQYAADGSGRLTLSNSSPNQNNWTYDVFGNRATEYTGTTTSAGDCQGTRSFTYAEDNRLLRRSHTTSLCDDALRYFSDQTGARLGEADTAKSNLAGAPPINGLRSMMTYTAKGQLFFSATPSGGIGSYDFNWNWYDGEGLRVIAQAGTRQNLYPMPHYNDMTGGRSYYYYDGSDVALTLVRQMTAQGAVTWTVHQRLLVGGVDQVLAGRYWQPGSASGQNLAMIGDRQGTAMAAVKSNGQIECESALYTRNAFGSLQDLRSTGCGSGSLNLGVGFTGASTPNTGGGFTYLRNRWYDPQTGRFLSQDPIGLAGGVNLYAYAGNDPVSYTDPFGLSPCPPDCDGSDAADLAAGMTPGVSTLHDAATVATGNNYITGESVGAGDRLTAFAGLVTPASGGEIRAAGKAVKFTAHAVHQAINRNIKPAAIWDALKNAIKVGPVKLDTKGRPSQRIMGRHATVAQNPETGAIVSVNPTSSQRRNKALKDQGSD